MSEKSQKELAKETMAVILEAKEKVNNKAAFEKEVFANLGISENKRVEDPEAIIKPSVSASFMCDR